MGDKKDHRLGKGLLNHPIYLPPAHAVPWRYLSIFNIILELSFLSEKTPSPLITLKRALYVKS